MIKKQLQFGGFQFCCCCLFCDLRVTMPIVKTMDMMCQADRCPLVGLDFCKVIYVWQNIHTIPPTKAVFHQWVTSDEAFDLKFTLDCNIKSSSSSSSARETLIKRSHQAMVNRYFLYDFLFLQNFIFCFYIFVHLYLKLYVIFFIKNYKIFVKVCL